MTIAFTVCNEVMAYLGQGTYCGMVDGVMTIPAYGECNTYCYCIASNQFTGSVSSSMYDGYNWQAPLFKNPSTQVPYQGPGCTSGGGHAVTLIGYKNIVNASGATVPSWILENSWGNSISDGGYFYLPIDTASRTDDAPGAVGLRQPVGISFTKATARLLSEKKDRHLAMQRRAQAVLSNPGAATGILVDCSKDKSAVQQAADTAKRIFDNAKSASYSDFVVHTLECK